VPNLQIRVGLDASRRYVARCKLLPGGVVTAGSLSSLRWRCVNALNGRSVDFVLSMEARLLYAKQHLHRVAPAATGGDGGVTEGVLRRCDRFAGAPLGEKNETKRPPERGS
jgi:hypothetical protein